MTPWWTPSQILAICETAGTPPDRILQHARLRVTEMGPAVIVQAGSDTVAVYERSEWEASVAATFPTVDPAEAAAPWAGAGQILAALAASPATRAPRYVAAPSGEVVGATDGMVTLRNSIASAAGYALTHGPDGWLWQRGMRVCYAVLSFWPAMPEGAEFLQYPEEVTRAAHEIDHTRPRRADDV